MTSQSDTSSQAASHDMPEEEEQWDDWEEDESGGVRCLLSDTMFPTVDAALAHDKEQGFDVRSYMLQEHLGQYDVIKVINYFRSEVQEGRNPASALQDGSRPWDSDTYFQPVLPDDELLFHDWEEEEGSWHDRNSQQQQSRSGRQSEECSVAQLQRENQALLSTLQAMQAVLLQDEGADGLAELLRQQQLGTSDDTPSTSAAAAHSTTSFGSQGQAATPGVASAEAERIDQSYFESYSFFDIHHEMLSDRVRTEAYRAALENNPSLMKGASVLDVGCGTAILSMFAARGGAAAVVGVDGSEEIAKYARANCAANGLSSEDGGPVSIVTGRVEALQQLPLPESSGGKVDVLVSEWMGYALLFESMLDSVLVARDRFLKPGGAMLPDLANIYVAAGGEASTGLAFWQLVYGFTMSPIQDSIRQSALKRAVVRSVSGDQLVSSSVRVKCLDLATMMADDQDFTAQFRLEPQSRAGRQACHSLVVWFDTEFSQRFCRDCPVTLSTAPDAPQTHWVQAVLLLREPIELVSPAAAASEGETNNGAVAIEGWISFARNKARHRSLDIAVQYCAVYCDGSRSPEEAAIYAMGVSDS